MRAPLLLPLLLAMAAPAFGQETPQMPGSGSTADHSKFEILKQEFKSGPEVTAACLSCHTEASDQVMHTLHYQWDYQHQTTGQQLGKKNVINAFCGSVAGNEPRCTSCHAGYGWEDMNQPPPQQATAVDCLACHDTSGQYTKSATGAGNPPLAPVKPGTQTITGKPAWPVDLSKAAMSVGKPTRENCGNCHFYGGGGDNVKHGDLSSALINPSIHTDVHMSPDGANMVCTDCHVTESHQWAGSRYDVHATDPEGTGKPGERRHVATCESCHGNEPHPVNIKGIKLNDHTDVVACQTCHIPSMAKGGVATKTFWDWSTAGKLKDGKPYHENDFVDSNGNHLHTYLSTKGDFKWEENAQPIYEWFNGQVEYTTSDSEHTIDPTQVVEVNKIAGDAEDGRSRIWPFKRMEGRQAYDSELNKLVYTHVWGPTTDTAFWTNFDWAKAIDAGMKAAGAEYSGQFGFVDTYMYWPTTHMVAPANEALECQACHAEDGRLANIAGVFMPGTGDKWHVGLLGKLMFVMALLGVLGHGALRIFTGKKKGGSHD
ncbi:tetrathionate reductase family octaheme c-type cytochrome [Mesobacterium sp. TK19101]|uniref:Tetrathionate reductase family octaheme c-type cytochrome n=1 Tax=Mesobacterium hydrothermale TaxID=3111907 RepID=A0ABU6HJN6_9RHOB|nr:tetrathionate reductase family octaheme c-type cytochrome [Mesobacterium sp. TK19101]MEC3862116.1 tetrathionate reductase family octaheme c-type cytochrome [Mesobacterium sp. TK19101]